MKQIVLKKVSKSFIPYSFILKECSLLFDHHKPFVIKGSNGSGKSTLLHIITGLILPDEGTVTYFLDNREIGTNNIFKHISYTSPSIDLPEEFTVIGFLEWLNQIKPLYTLPNQIIEDYNLGKIAKIKIRNLSSGMYQRIKLIQAFMCKSDFLIIDEPCMNFDQEGYSLYYQLIKKYTKDRIFILASNDNREFEFDYNEIEIEKCR